jgi:hypothetical protein
MLEQIDAPSARIDHVSVAPHKVDETLADLTEKVRKEFKMEATLDESKIDSNIRLGGLLKKVKSIVPHGNFKAYCIQEFNLRPTSCSLYMNLFDNSENIGPARDWARGANHKWKDATRPERVLKIIEEWKASLYGGTPTTAPSEKKAEKKTSTKAELERQVEEYKKDIAALRDELPAEVIDDVKFYLEANDDDSKALLASIALRYHWRFVDLVETFSALKV